jgi:2-polyprenyl-6-methoxyphenol hydroxylase-like FAD-dependent oxidoreductase
MTETCKNHAIVLGGSIAGLMAARVLTEHFQLVTLIERDRLPAGAENRKGVPQGRHIHTLLTRGYEILLKYFPDMKMALEADGGIIGDSAGSFRSFRDGAYTPRFHSGLVTTFQSRPLLESEIRQRLLSIPNLRIVDGADVEAIVASDNKQRITGVMVRLQGDDASPERIDAELVVDATGRGSQAVKWLSVLGYSAPEERMNKMDLAYTSRVYQRTPQGLGGADALLVASTPPDGKRGAGILPIEGDRWLVTLAGYLGDHAPADESGFLEWARSLPTSDVYNAIKDAVPLGPIVVHRYPFSRRRYFEKMVRLPEGFIVVGDAFCSFNPVYGQGMSVAAMEAETLDNCLKVERANGWRGDFPLRYFRQAAKVVDIPWALAAGADFRYPAVEGERPHTPALVNWYMHRFFRAALYDRTVAQVFLRVAHLVQPPSSFFHPAVVLRVLFFRAPAHQAQMPADGGRELGHKDRQPEHSAAS